MKDLGSRFAEVEKRVRALVAENDELRGRVRALEADLGRAQQDVREAQQLRARKAQVQERLMRLLTALEAAEAREALTVTGRSESAS